MKKPEPWTIDGNTNYSADLKVLYPKYAEGIRNGTAEFPTETQYVFVQSLTTQVERELNYLIAECVKDAIKRE